VDRVGALGAALAGLHPNPRAKGDNHVSAAFGAYRGQPALAAGYFRHIGNQTMFSVGVSTTSKDWSANTGVTFSW
jgi:autotransporter adhesin